MKRTVLGFLLLIGTIAVRPVLALESLTLDRLGIQADGNTLSSTVSADGRYILFDSYAHNLMPGTTNIGSRNIYLYDRSDRHLELISVDSNGQVGNGHSLLPDITPDGRYVVFQSRARLAPGATDNSTDQIYIRDRQTGTTRLVSANASGIAGNYASTRAHVSADGKLVVFESVASNLTPEDRNVYGDIFIKHLDTGAVELVDKAADGGPTNAYSYDAFMTSNGRYVTFSSFANNITPSAPPGTYIYLKDRVTGTLQMVTRSDSDQPFNGQSYLADLDESGRYVVFYTQATNIYDGYTSSTVQVVMHDMITGTNTLISKGMDGAAGDGYSYLPRISDDGKYVAFLSYANNLVPGMNNNKADSYLYDVQTGNISLLSKPNDGGIANDGTAFNVISQDGSVILLSSYASNLVANDSNGYSDLFIYEQNFNSPPVANAGGNQTLECSGIASPVTLDGRASSDPDNDPLSYSWSGDFGAATGAVATVPMALGNHSVTLSVDDAKGGVDTDSANILIRDSLAPTLELPARVSLEAQSREGAPFEPNPRVSDLCGAVGIAITPSYSNYPLGETSINVTATDSSGNSSTATEVVSVADTTPPVLDVPADIQHEAVQRETPLDIGMATASDIFDVNISNNAPPAYPLGNTVVTWRAQDSNGNSSEADQSVHIVDTTPPAFSSIPNDIVSEATAVLSPLSLSPVNATDIFDVTISSNAPASYPLGTTLVTWTATDTSGNKATTQQRVTIQDTTAPQLTVPGNVAAEATGVTTPVELGTPGAEDIFPVSLSNNAPVAYPLGNTVVTWTASDSSGNTTTAEQQVTVRDTTAPVLSVPADKVVEAVARLTPVSLTPATATDLFPVTVSNNAPADFPLGMTQVTWRAVDSNGNTTEANQTVQIVDTTAPVFTNVPSDVISEATAVLSPLTLIPATASDIFDVTVSNDAPASYPLGTTVVTWYARDTSGNVTSTKQRVTLQDTIAPKLSAPADIFAEATGVTTPVDLGTPSTKDIFPVTVNNNSPNAYPLGTTVVTWSASDTSGNTTTATQQVTVRDTTAPVLSVPADRVVEAVARLTPVSLTPATATDLFPVTISNNAPALYPLGTTLVTWRAEDSNGNVSSGQQRITVVDTTAPQMTLETLHDHLWPPNHRMREVARLGQVQDLVDASPKVDISVQVLDSPRREHDNDGNEKRQEAWKKRETRGEHGDEHRHQRRDWKVVQRNGVWHIFVRASLPEHSGERVYDILATATDASGNVQQASTQVSIRRPQHSEHSERSEHSTSHQRSDRSEHSNRRRH